VDLVLSNSAIYGLISQTDFFEKDIANKENTNKYYVIHKGDFVYNPRKSMYAPYGPINILEQYDVGIVSPLYNCFKIEDKYSMFLKWYFKSTKWHRYVYIHGDQGARGDRVSIKDEIFFNMPIYIPNELERNKIITLLNIFSRKIELLEAKISILKKYKKGIKKIAVKDSINYWKNNSIDAINLGDFLEEIKEYCENNGTYSHVTLSKEGIYPKTDRYDRDFLVKTEDKKYRITRLDQLCYNPANLKFGVICINKYGKGIFSPIYITFKIKNIIEDYLELIVTSNDFINYCMKYQQGTVYERMSVSVEDFIKIKIVPTNSENQHRLASVSFSLDKKISKLESELLNIQKFKTNLLSKLFI